MHLKFERGEKAAQKTEKTLMQILFRKRKYIPSDNIPGFFGLKPI